MELGHLDVRLTLAADGQRIAALLPQVRSPQVRRLFVGQTAEQVGTLLPLMFSVCSRAQAAACHAALQAAREGVGQHVHDPGVAQEAARETLLHLLSQHDRSALAEALRALTAAPPALATLLQAPLGMPVADWLAFTTADALDAWLADSHGPLAHHLAGSGDEPLQPGAPLLRMDADDIRNGARPVCDAMPDNEAADALGPPRWQGRAVETGAVVRQARHPLIAALADRPWLQRRTARLRELLLFAQGEGAESTAGAVTSLPLGAGHGAAWVQTARGLLWHEVHVEAGRVTDYRLIAPTDWNFHPEGSLARWLTGTRVRDAGDARLRVGDAVAALDPCVPWRLQIQQ